MFMVYRKELLELLRDKKTLFFIIALPTLIFPVLFGLMGLLVANIAQDEQRRVLNYSIVNAEQAPAFAKAIKYHRDFKEHALEAKSQEQIIEQVRAGAVDLVIEIPLTHQNQVNSHEEVQWQVYYNDASQINSVRSKLNKVFKPYIEDIRRDLMLSFKLTDEQFALLSKPISLKTVDTADERENLGEKIGGFIPYLLIILCMTGAMYPAIDIGAGEKERGTLETLLLTPQSRLAIVLGKFFTIMTTGIFTALIAVSSLLFWSYFIGELADIDAVKRVMSSVGILDMSLVLLMLLPVSAIFAAILLAISIYAKSFKEAQNYMGPVSILGFMPVMIVMLPGVQLDGIWSYIPISNVALAIKEILKGTIEYQHLVGIFGSSVVFALLSVSFCVYWFKKESVLFR